VCQIVAATTTASTQVIKRELYDELGIDFETIAPHSSRQLGYAQRSLQTTFLHLLGTEKVSHQWLQHSVKRIGC
jgi:hypothetical protein